MSTAATGAAIGNAIVPGVGAVVGAVAGAIVDVVSAKKSKARRKAEATIRAAAERYESEGQRNDLEAAADAARTQEAIALERAALEEDAQAEQTRQSQMLLDAGNLDINIQRIDPVERKQRRQQFFQEAPQ